MIKMTIQDTEETAEFKVLEKPIIQKPLIAESDVVTIDNNLSTYVTGTQKQELTVGLGYLDSVGYETLRRIRDRQYAVLKYPTVTITADEPVDLGYGEDVPDYRQRILQLKGKNLCSSEWESGGYDNSTGEKSTSSGYRTISKIPVKQDTTYIWSRDGSGVALNVLAFNASGTYLGVISGAAISAGNSFTTPATCAYITAWRGASGGIANMQLELGEEITTYEPYYNIELCKIGDYQDRIYKSGDKWYVHKEVGSYTFDGSEAWARSGSTTSTVFVAATGVRLGDYIQIKIGEASQSLFDRFTFSTQQAGAWGRFNLYNGTDYYQSLAISFDITDIPDITAAKAWLASNTPTFYGVLATPTDTEITNATLKTQLDALQNSAFDRWTQIETSVQEPSLQPYLTVTQGEITGSGKEVMLEGTTEDLLDFVILGDTYQQTYSGKNLFKIDNNNGVWHASANVNGSSISATCETAGISYVAVLIPNSDSLLGKTCTLSVGGAFPNTPGRNGRVIVADSSSTSLQSVNNIYAHLNNIAVTGGSLTFTFPSSYSSGKNCFVVGFYTSNVTTGTAVGESVTYSDVQIEIGSQATAFEPYVGGTASPNPDYPQDVQTVNGDIAFDFSGPSGIKTYTMVGKMTLADQRITDNCGTNEQVQVSFRESKQL